jgi:hypothetical protein
LSSICTLVRTFKNNTSSKSKPIFFLRHLEFYYWKSRELLFRLNCEFLDHHLSSRMPKIWRGIKLLSEDFVSLTTIHGLPHIVLSKRIWMKIFWFIITVSMACGFFYQLIFQLIRTYLNYPVNVDTKVGLWWFKFFTKKFDSRLITANVCFRRWRFACLIHGKPRIYQGHHLTIW